MEQSKFNVLRWHVSCETGEPSDLFAEYWSSDNEKHFYSNVSENSTAHAIELINLEPDRQYHVKLHGKTGKKLFEKDAGSFITDSLPANLPRFDLLNDDLEFDGYILIKTFVDSGAYVLINSKAEIVWYESYDSIQLRPFEWTNDHHIVSLQDHNIILEFDMNSVMLHDVDISVKAGYAEAHHEIMKNSAGNYLFLTKEKKMADLRKYGGIENDSIMGDGIMEMDPRGNVVWKWSIFDHVDPLKEKGFFKVKFDWGHANSIAYAKDGNLLVSFRDFSQIWKIDKESGNVLWKFGKNGDFGLQPEDEFQRQHTAHINRHGNLLIFDNGTTKRGYSAVRSFALNEQNRSYKPVINFKLDKSLFAARMGSAYMVDDTHVLVCRPVKDLYLIIFDFCGNEVWKAQGTLASYRALYIDATDIENQRPF